MTRFIDLVHQDHHNLQGHFNHVLECKTSEERAQWQNVFAWEMARQIVAQDMILYPTLKKVTSEGSEFAGWDLNVREKIKDLVITFSELAPSHPDFESLARKIWNMYSGQLEEDEFKTIQRLEESLSKDESADLAGAFGRTKHIVPPRYAQCTVQQHPSPFETVSSLLQAPVEKIRDALRKFPQDE